MPIEYVKKNGGKNKSSDAELKKNFTALFMNEQDKKMNKIKN